MWPQRLKRFALLLLAVGVVYLAFKFFTLWPGKDDLSNQVLGSMDQAGTQAVKSGGQVLENLVEEAPISLQIKNEILRWLDDTSSLEGSSAAEIIMQQQQNMVNSVEDLPQAGVKEIKKEVFRDFCNDILN